MSALRITVLGAGLMGHGIAQVFLQRGADVTIWDPSPDALRTVNDRIVEHIEAIGEEVPSHLAGIGSTPEDAVDGADLVVEAAPEKLTLKRDLLQRVSAVNADAIIATNTSVLRISEIATTSTSPERVVGTHWWNPPYLIDLVEVVRGEQTSDETVERVSTILRQVGKQPVEVFKDIPGFVGNRMQFALVREAIHLVEEGVCTAETVDLVARLTFGRRWAAVGPLENSDFIGLDLVAAILDYVAPTLASDRAAPASLTAQLAAGHLGAKTGQGYFTWPEGQQALVERRLLAHLQTGRRDAATG